MKEQMLQVSCINRRKVSFASHLTQESFFPLTSLLSFCNNALIYHKAMGFPLRYTYGLLCALLLMPAISYSQDFTSSRAAFYRTADGLGTPTGACGYQEYGRTVNDAYVTGVSKLYRNGTGCGACYQVRCKAPQLCTDKGVNVVVTDYGEGDRTDFILSSRAYARMARPKKAADLFAYGVVDIEYRRIPCRYPGHNLMFKVHENSRFPEYLAIVILYQGGVNDVLAVEIWQDDYKQWKGMRKAYGAVWDMPNPPTGALTVRLRVRGSAGSNWLQANDVIPGDWEAGAAYDSDFQLY